MAAAPPSQARTCVGRHVAALLKQQRRLRGAPRRFCWLALRRSHFSPNLTPASDSLEATEDFLVETPYSELSEGRLFGDHLGLPGPAGAQVVARPTGAAAKLGASCTLRAALPDDGAGDLRPLVSAGEGAG